jgi:hypothetical protein
MKKLMIAVALASAVLGDAVAVSALVTTPAAACSGLSPC